MGRQTSQADLGGSNAKRQVAVHTGIDACPKRTVEPSQLYPFWAVTALAYRATSITQEDKRC
jgi:hypothetical protein